MFWQWEVYQRVQQWQLDDDSVSLTVECEHRASQPVLYDHCHRHYKIMITLTVGSFVVDLNKCALLSQDGHGCRVVEKSGCANAMRCHATSWLARGVKKSKSSDVLP